MKILITNRNKIKTFSPKQLGLGTTALIRITSQKRFTRLSFRTEFDAILYCRFADVEDSQDFARSIMQNEQQRLIPPISDDEAIVVVNFIRKHCADVDTLVVHCDAGFSRSPAVALAAADILGLIDVGRELRDAVSQGVYQPNITVYQKIAGAAGLRDQRQADLDAVFGLPL